MLSQSAPESEAASLPWRLQPMTARACKGKTGKGRRSGIQAGEEENTEYQHGGEMLKGANSTE